MQKYKNYKSLMKKKLLYSIIIIFIISLPILAAEIYLKYVGLGDPIIYDKNYVYGYAPRPNQKKLRIRNSTVTINDVGLRSLKNWKMNRDKKKIIFFGDSVTYGGSYIDDKEIFSHLTCEKMNDLIIFVEMQVLMLMGYLILFIGLNMTKE